MEHPLLRTATTVALAVFGFAMGGVAWDELVNGSQLPDASWILFLGLPAFFASMTWLSKHLEMLLPENADGQPRWRVGALAVFVFFIPGGALYITRSVFRATRDTLHGTSSLQWLGWAVSCTGMQVSMIAELSGASPTVTFDGLYAASGVLNALAVITLMWTTTRIPAHGGEIRQATP